MAGTVQDLPSTEEIVEITVSIIDAHRSEPGALIPTLQRVQQKFGYLPTVALYTIARELEIPYSEVTGVLTFYSYFTTVPRGRHVVRACLGTACYVRGGKAVVEAASSELGIEVGHTTEDRQFSLETGRCFGACGLAPVVMVDDTVFQRITPARVSEILTRYHHTADEEVTE